MHRKWRSSDRNYALEISPQPLCRKRLGKMGLLQGCNSWCSHDQLRQEKNQIRRLVWGAYRDNGSSNRRKEESVGCKQDLPEGKNYRLYSLRVVMRNDAPDAVQMNTALTSVLVEDSVLKTLTYTTFTTKLKRTHWISAATIARVSLNTSSGEGVLYLPCFAVCLNDYIKLQGDWKSTAYERYLDHALRYKLEAI